MAYVTDTQLAASNGSSLVGHIAGDANAEPRTVQGKLRDFINVMDFHDPLDGNDITNALEKLIYEAFPTLKGGLKIYIPEGEYAVTRPILPARQVNIRGAGMFATVLIFYFVQPETVNATMKGCFAFGLESTLNAYDPDIANKVVGEDGTVERNGADYSTIEDLAIQVIDDPEEASGLNYGIWSAARIFARNVYLRGCGAKLEAGTRRSAVDAGSVIGNANSSEFNNCHSIYATEHGFMTDGDDVNACRFIGCNAYVPTTYGFFECGLIGNSYVGCHASGGNTATSGYKVGNALETSRSSFIGCYAEEDFDGDAWDVLLPAVVIAPQGALPVSAWNKNSVLTGSAGGGFSIGDKLNFVADLNGWALGDSTHPATRLFPGGMLIRGQGDGNLYYTVGQGGGLGLTGGTGASVVKALVASPYTQYELVHYGDTRHRPAFPRGLIATLPTYASNAAATTGGLTAGEVYKTATGEVRIVV